MMAKGDDIAARLRRFAVGAVHLCRRLPEDAAGKHIGRQLVRAATGGGANYEEARGAESRADFIHKLGVLVREADELVAILTSSIKTAKQRAAAADVGSRAGME